jgi:cell division protein ZapA
VSEPVDVRILDREFTVGCEPGERDALMAAAAFLDARMREVRGTNKMAPLDRVAVLTALNLASELLQGRKDGGSHDAAVARALGEMNVKLDGLFDSLALR